MTVFGHSVCSSCGALVLTELSRVTGGRCGDCHRTSVVNRTVEIRSQGRRMTLHRPGRKRRKGPKSPNERRRQHVVEKVKGRALRRLRDLYPEVYLALLADERLKVGMDPYPLQTVVRLPGQTITDPAVYHAPTDQE